MTDVKTKIDTAEQLKAEVELNGRASWRENDQRLIWCGSNGDGTFTFRNTTSPISKGPKISEAEADRILHLGLTPHCIGLPGNVRPPQAPADAALRFADIAVARQSNPRFGANRND